MSQLPLEDYGITLDDVRAYYRGHFGVESMQQCTQLQWAICAAEAQAMVESIEIFLDRVDLFSRLDFHLCAPCYQLHEIQGHGVTLTRPIAAPRDRYCHACRRKSDQYHISYGHNVEFTGAHANSEYYFSQSSRHTPYAVTQGGAP